MPDLAITDAVIATVVANLRTAASELEGTIPTPAGDVFGRHTPAAVSRSIDSENEFRREVRHRIDDLADGVEASGEQFGSVDAFLGGLT